jgi:hypothetical protein
LRGFGEALVQFFIIGGFIFLLERLDLFQITVLSWDTTIVWWLAETGIVLILILLVSLSLVNIIFAFAQRLRWWARGILESIVFLPIFFLIDYLFSSITDFGYSDLYYLILLLFVPVLISNLIFNRYIPLPRDRSKGLRLIIKRYEDTLED